MRNTEIDQDVQRYTNSDEFALSPRYVIYQVTQRWDPDWALWSSLDSPVGLNELTTAESRSLIEQICAFPVAPTLVLTGGDPLTRTDLFGLIEQAHDGGLQVELSAIATPLVTCAALRHMHHAGLSKLSLLLDGATAATHDSSHSAGSFERTIEILDDAHDTQLATHVVTTLTPTTAAELAAIADELVRRRVQAWSIRFPLEADNAQVPFNEYEQLYERIWELDRRHAFTINTIGAPHYRRFVMLHQHPDTWTRGGRSRTRHMSPQPFFPSKVNDGRGLMFIGHAGLIQPSDVLPVVCGAFPFDDVVHVYQNSSIFAALRDPDRVEGKCRHCGFKHFCGGSRAHAYEKTGNLFAQDPHCTYVPLRTG